MLQLIIEGWGYITLEQIPHYTDIATLHPNPICNHSIFRHDNFIGCFSADKIKMSARK